MGDDEFVQNGPADHFEVEPVEGLQDHQPRVALPPPHFALQVVATRSHRQNFLIIGQTGAAGLQPEEELLEDAVLQISGRFRRVQI